MTTLEPIDTAFNVAVLQMASRVCPCGYDVGDEAPNTLDELKAHYARTKRIKVWSGASDNTIFADREVNWAFRAWHDWTHLRHDLPFTLEGEARAAQYQTQDLFKVYGYTSDSYAWADIIDAEVTRQAQYFALFGKFPDDQRAFDLTRLHCLGRYLQVNA